MRDRIVVRLSFLGGQRRRDHERRPDEAARNPKQVALPNPARGQRGRF